MYHLCIQGANYIKLKKEFLVEYISMKLEEMIAYFCCGDYDTLVLDSNYTLFYNQDGIKAFNIFIINTNLLY